VGAGNWRATEIDFGQDRVDWRERLTDEQRRSALWLYTLFFHGEDSVADNLSPYIDAAPLEEQKYFLTTQQVDEARHAVFFNRFMHEVVGVGDGTLAGGLQATADQITWGHRQVFSRLDRMADELRRDRSKPKLAAAVTLYHLVVEASLAQPGQHMIEASLEELDVLPGFREGMRNVALDEQRHIGFGVKLLADLCREDPAPIQDAIVGLIKEVLPWTSAVAKPPNWDRSYTECFGFTLEDLGEAGATSIEQRLRAVGLPVDTIPGFPMPWTSRRASAPSAPGSSARATTAWSRTPRRSRSCSTRSAAERSPTPCGRGRRSSGTSPTPRRGTWSSTTGARGRWRAARRAPM
jgi:ribonucleotide reductase beta subunit family protein with ferritin-like domain